MIWVLVIFLVLLTGILAVSVTLFRFAAARNGALKLPLNIPEVYREQMERGTAWFLSQNVETVCIRSRDHLRLSGRYLPHPESKGTIILVHGYRGRGEFDFSCIFRTYYEMGYSLLVVSQRATGDSEGRYITFGVKERFDIADWAFWLAERNGPEHAIFFDGISMGAATVLLAAGLPLPANVKGILADCGYTSAWEEFRSIIGPLFHLPVYPFLPAANLLARMLGGFSFREASTLDAMAKCRVPVLFLHGEADSLVPCRFSQENFDACRSEKTLLLVPGAGHGMSYLVDQARCEQAIREFLLRHTP